MRVKAIVLLGLMLAGTRLWAGPPFQTDDPQTVELGHFEFYQFASLSSTPVESDPTGPAFEFNWGAIPNVQLHAIAPFGAVIPSNNPVYRPGGVGASAYGFTDMETGAKIRFVQETKRCPQIGIYPMFELPTGSYGKGLGVGKVWYKMPVWVQKSWGEWTAYGGAGYQIVPQTEYRNFLYAGGLLQRNIGHRLVLGGEVFCHQKEGFATAQTQAATMVDIGGTYNLKGQGLQLLFAYGHSVMGQTENYAYLGLYQTWGGKRGKGADGLLARLFSSDGGR